MAAEKDIHKSDIIKNAMTLFSREHVTEIDVNEYFSDDYVQHVDGKILDKKEFVQHVQVLNGLIQSISFEFEHIIEKPNHVATVHYVDVKKKDGSQSKVKVIAIFEFKNDKISSCHELTQLIAGDNKDADLGSKL